MSRTPSRAAQFLGSASDEDVLDLLRSLAVRDHSRGRSLSIPTSNARDLHSHPNNRNLREEVVDRHATEDYNGSMIATSHPHLQSAAAHYISPARTDPSPPSVSREAESTMTRQEIMSWSLGSSVSARDQVPMRVNTPQTSIDDSLGMPETQQRIYSLSPSPYQGSFSASIRPPAPVAAPQRMARPAFVPTTPVAQGRQDQVLVTFPPSSLVPVPAPFFRPNEMVLRNRGLGGNQPLQSNSGSNYVGVGGSGTNPRETPNLQDSENCALFVINIPATASLHEIFSVIKTGKVFALHRNEPTLRYPTAAAKVVFFTPEAAAAFHSQINSFQGVVINGNRLRSLYNRNGYVRNTKRQSRVLIIEGPTPMMTLEFWTSRFTEYSEFELECFQQSPGPTPGRSTMEFRFVRVDGQAQTCLQCIKADESMIDIVHANYGFDPCEPL